MPLTESGNKVRNKMHEEYGEKEGDKVFYSKENGDKKFRKLVTGHSKRKAVWWASRLNKLPPQMKVKLISTLKSNKTLSWWMNRLDMFQTHCGHSGR
jgi:hypothetical protein